ncbi:hypothetical protein Tco_1320700 [Tanacetum coccineum]
MSRQSTKPRGKRRLIRGFKEKGVAGTSSSTVVKFQAYEQINLPKLLHGESYLIWFQDALAEALNSSDNYTKTNWKSSVNDTLTDELKDIGNK